MKIKATYKSKANRRSVLVEGITFVNGHSITADLSYTGIMIIKKAAADGWFTIEKEWDKDGNVIGGNKRINETPEVTEQEEVVETPEVTEQEEVVETPEVTEQEEVAETPEVTEQEEVAETPEVTEQEEVDFSAMTKPELITYAEEHGIEVNSSMKKDEIIATITKN